MLSEFIVAIIMLGLLGALLYPFPSMPPSMLMAIVATLGVVFVAFASFLWREQPRDEREEHHRYLASRLAFLVGIGLLVVAVIVQSLQHRLDAWIAVTLGAMILAKVAGLIYARSRK